MLCMHTYCLTRSQEFRSTRLRRRKRVSVETNLTAASAANAVPSALVILALTYSYSYFRMLAQSYTPNLYTPPLYHNFFIIISPLFFATVSIPIRFEPRIHPPVEYEHRETKTFTRKTSQPIRNLFVCPGPGLSEFRIKGKESD